MSRAMIIDGKAIAQALRREVAAGVADARSASAALTPGLAVVLVGEDPASQVYVRTKAKATADAGMLSVEHRLPADTPQAALLALIAELNARADVHGILVQLPLPAHIDARQGDRGDRSRPRTSTASTPSTSAGWRRRRQGAGAVHADGLRDPGQVGASRACGARGGGDRPLQHRRQADGAAAAGENCTVTIAHSRTRDLPAVVRRADLVVAAVGRPEMVRGDWIKPGAIVIDVGIQRVTGAGRQEPPGRRRRLRGGACRWPARSRRCRAASGR